LFLIFSVFSLYPKECVFILFVALIFYCGIHLLFKKRLKINSKVIAENNELILKVLQETSRSARQLIVDNKLSRQHKRFSSLDKAKRIAEANNALMSASPKIFIEFSVFVAFLCSASYLFLNQNPSVGALTLSSLVTLLIASQKLLPSFQNIFCSVSGINGSIASLRSLFEFKHSITSNQALYRNNVKDVNLSLPCIALSNLSYTYPSSNKPVIFDRSLAIPFGSKIGFFGASGAGKSTLLNILLGLIEPTNGTIKINNFQLSLDNDKGQIHDSLWNITSIVPQSIVLVDDSILFNITHERSLSRVDLPFLREVISACRIQDFLNQTSEGLDFIVGENGCNLSGGQIQRLGIARAMYKRPKILILDEPTSALDSSTADLILDYLFSMDITILFVSHKIDDLARCSSLVRL